MTIRKSQNGFVLVIFLIIVMMLLVIGVSLLGKSNEGEKKSLPEVKTQAETDTQDINQNLQNYQQQINEQ